MSMRMAAALRLAGAAVAAVAAAAFGAEQVGSPGVLDRGYEYEIVSTGGARIGTYSVAVQGPRDGSDGNFPAGTWLQRARFVIGLGGLLEQSRYEAIDNVVYDRAGLRSYRIDENDKGVKTVVVGARSGDGRTLVVTTDGASGATRKEIAAEDFDLTLFGLRFPRPCGPAQVGRRTPLRLLVPRSGTLARVDSTVREFGPRGSGEHAVPVCTVVTHTADGKYLKESWVRSDGVMIREAAADFVLVLEREGPASMVSIP